MRPFGRFLRVTLTSGVAAAVAVAVLIPVAAFAVTSLGAHIELQPLTIRAVSEPSTVYDACNRDPGPGRCGPNDVIATLSDANYSEPLSSLAQAPAVVVKAVLDAEDRTFWYHGPIDVRSIVRAAEADVSHHGIVQGGSTITQQVVKNEVLTPKRTFTRKVTEVIDSYRLFNKWSRSQILLQYLNTVYFGYGAYGIQAASKVYFGVTVDQLDPAQAAFLAGMIRNPSLYDPIHNPHTSMVRRNEVIDQMAQDSNLTPKITAQEAALLKVAPLPTNVHPPAQQHYSPFVTEVVQYLLHDPKFGATQTLRYNELFKGGLKIYTTFEPSAQVVADQAVAAKLPDTQGKFTAALVAMNPVNGYVEAIVPGNPATDQGYDVATGYGGSGRQPGSSYKAIVMATALANGIGPEDSVDGNSPCTFYMPGVQKPYIAHNAEPGYGIMSVQQALTDSVNCAFIRIGLAVGDAKIASMAQAMGVNDPLDINPSLPGSSKNPLLGVPSIAIGSEAATPLEMASVFSTIDDGGVYHTPVFVKKVYTPSATGDQVLLDNTRNQGKQVLSTSNAQLETQMLEQVIQYGTGTAAALPGRPAAGKTGTTDSYQDGWFVGFVPQLVTAVWMGDPAGEVSMYNVGGETVFGGTYPAEIWQYFMAHYLSGQPVIDFKSPPSGSIPGGGRLIGCSNGNGYAAGTIGGLGTTTCGLGESNTAGGYDTTTTVTVEVPTTTEVPTKTSEPVTTTAAPTTSSSVPVSTTAPVSPTTTAASSPSTTTGGHRKPPARAAP